MKKSFDSTQNTPRTSPSRSRSPTPQQKQKQKKIEKKYTNLLNPTQVKKNLPVSSDNNKRKIDLNNNLGGDNLSSTEEDDSHPKKTKKTKKTDFSIPFSAKNIVICGFKNEPVLLKNIKRKINILGGNIQNQWVPHGTNASHLLVYYSQDFSDHDGVYDHVVQLGGSTLSFLDVQNIYETTEKYIHYNHLISELPSLPNIFSGYFFIFFLFFYFFIFFN